jgi:hypothetical protein
MQRHKDFGLHARLMFITAPGSHTVYASARAGTSALPSPPPPPRRGQRQGQGPRHRGRVGVGVAGSRGGLASDGGGGASRDGRRSRPAVVGAACARMLAHAHTRQRCVSTSARGTPVSASCARTHALNVQWCANNYVQFDTPGNGPFETAVMEQRITDISMVYT